MTLDEIREMWKEDCQIDMNDLDTENFKCTVIHEKYLNIYSHFRLMLSDAEVKNKRLYKQKFEYYSGKAPAKVYAENPFNHKVLKGDLNTYIWADDEFLKSKQKIDYLETCINYLEMILKQCASRGFQIKNFIDLRKHADY
ncbi:UvsY protein [Synechococcus phage S-SZBM1]|uniref:UvsY protein n=1 Tax=Synechococcus phage S-SZBM1 TaxID=2926475 RepID=A0AC61TSR3_9CAUD|nr:UvsY-like recombination mediator [Synechococcus phage S-SZBM1]UNH61290.1 UvsY protein [Synechococcus phage S-SZBM1]